MRRRFTVTETQNYEDFTMCAGTRVYEVHRSEANSRVVGLLRKVGDLNSAIFFLFEGTVRVATSKSNFLEEDV